MRLQDLLAGHIVLLKMNQQGPEDEPLFIRYLPGYKPGKALSREEFDHRRTGDRMLLMLFGNAGIDDPRAVTGGIAQALITTASGLGIAIISVFPFNYFNSRVDHAVHEMEKYAISLELACERNGKRSGKE